MPRIYTTTLLLSLLMLLGGCSSFLTETNPEEPWSKSRFRELRYDDTQRLAGEDRSKSTTSEYFTYVPRKLWGGIVHVYQWATNDMPTRYAKNLFDKNPDLRREAVYVLSDENFGRRDPYTKYYAHMAESDEDQTVRAAALRALNRSRAQAYSGIYVTSLNDPSPWASLEAAKALANIPDPKAVPGMMKLLGDDKQTREVRIACADGLRCYKTSDVAQGLIRQLSDRDFGVAWQARQSLNLMTGRDYRYDQSAWLDYLTQNQTPFAAQ